MGLLIVYRRGKRGNIDEKEGERAREYLVRNYGNSIEPAFLYIYEYICVTDATRKKYDEIRGFSAMTMCVQLGAQRASAQYILLD